LRKKGLQESFVTQWKTTKKKDKNGRIQTSLRGRK